jgi:hypothetical protein
MALTFTTLTTTTTFITTSKNENPNGLPRQYLPLAAGAWYNGAFG